MNFFSLSFISGFSITLAAIIGLVRYRKVIPAYRPFITVCIVALLNELISYLLISQWSITNAINNNIYVLVELFLYIWQFYVWGAMRKRNRPISFIVILLLAVWVFDNLIWNDFARFNSLFKISAAFCIIILAIDQLNKLIFSEKDNLLANGRFLICCGLIIFFSYKATIEVFFLFNISFSNSFFENVFFILTLINLFVNLIFALAILCLPTKQRFILPFS